MLATIPVTLAADNLTSDTFCTLREAVISANTDTDTGGCVAVGLPYGADTITFSVPGPFNLTVGGAGENNAMMGDLDILDDLTIAGGPGGVVIDASTLPTLGEDRVFHIPFRDDSFVPNVAAAVDFEDLTIRGGTATDGGFLFLGSAGGGLALENAATVTIDDSVFVENSAVGGFFTDGLGGGIAVAASGGSLILTDSVVNDNDALGGDGAAGRGGGIYLDGPIVTVTNSTISNNAAVGGDDDFGSGGIAQGGGIYSRSATPTVSGSTIDSNSAVGGDGAIGFGKGGDVAGGGIYSELGTWTITAVPGTTISRNTIVGGDGDDVGGGDDGGDALGGGIHGVAADDWTVTNSTISSNQATGGNSLVALGTDGDALGGGLFSGVTNLFASTHVTIASNGVTAGTGAMPGAEDGGGIYADAASGVTLNSTIVGDNTAGTDPDLGNEPTASFTTTGYNLIEVVGSAAFTPTTGDITGMDPVLGSLANNGGPTETHVLLSGSPAIDTAAPTGPAFDQRGVSRPQGTAPDIGAVEVGAAVTIIDCPCDGGATKALLVTGSTTDDKIAVKFGSKAGQFKVTIKTGSKAGSKDMGTFKFEGSDADISKVMVYGLDGNDKIKVYSNLDVNAWLFGGDGDDKLRGGKGDDVIVGGSGDDQVDGKQGRDVLIGGHGADRIKGQKGEDILVAGPTSYDNNLTALCAIMAEWTSASAFADRVDHIMGTVPGGLNGPFVFNPDPGNGTVTVFNDGEKDHLTGGSGSDWFIADEDEDKISGLKPEDIFTELKLLWLEGDPMP